jgi:DNA-binding transcriptional regulator YhcF (GntR family)
MHPKTAHYFMPNSRAQVYGCVTLFVVSRAGNGCKILPSNSSWTPYPYGVTAADGLMNIRINKASTVPVRQQVAEQILLLIVTGKLKPGRRMPSVRELAHRLKIHRNTVSEAYQELVRRHWLVRHKGSHLTVRGRQEGMPLEGSLSLDGIVNMAIRVAREQGYTLQELRRHVREILSEEPPDHILVVAEEPGLRHLLQLEIQEALRWPVESCSEEDMGRNRGLAIGALVATPAFALPDVEPMVPKKRPPVSLGFGTADHLINEVDRLSDPSLIAIVSASSVCLRTAAGFLAPVVGKRHSLVQYLWPLQDSRALAGADLILCDSLAARGTKKRKCCVPYHLIDPGSMSYLQTAMESYQDN